MIEIPVAGATGLEPATFGVTGRRSGPENRADSTIDSTPAADKSGAKAPRFDSSAAGVETKSDPVAQCSGCGFLTADRRALTSCHGYCFDPSGKTCNALPCPRCSRVHYWTGSFKVAG